MNDNKPENLEISDLYLIHDGSLDLQPLLELAQDRRLIVLAWDQRADAPAGSRVILYLTAERVRELVPLAIERQWQLGVLPHPEAKPVTRALGVRGNIEAVFQHYLQTEAIEGAVLTCNDQMVFSSVVVGEVFGLRPYDIDQRPTRAGAFFRAVKATWDLRLRSYKLTTGKEQEIKLAALGMVVVENTQSPLIGRSFSEVLSISEGRLVLLALAPRSVLSYLWFLIRLLFPKKISLARLPHAVGLIRTDRVLLEAPQGVDYSLDGELASAESIEFRILEQRARVLPGPEFVHRADQGPSKDIIRIKHLPVDETAREMIEKPLPFFTHASEEDHRDLFVALRGEAALTSPYLVLMILSVLLALTGLYANSAPVIIGAMILAPLMAPIVSLAMGLARMDPSLIRNSLRTMGIGIGAGLLCAVFVAWITPLENLTSEMRARLSPTLLDLGVAVISGIAGAYAHAKEEIAKSLAGVAIAVALVPPLSVAGIGLGWGDWVMARGGSSTLHHQPSGNRAGGQRDLPGHGVRAVQAREKRVGDRLAADGGCYRSALHRLRRSRGFGRDHGGDPDRRDRACRPARRSTHPGSTARLAASGPPHTDLVRANGRQPCRRGQAADPRARRAGHSRGGVSETAAVTLVTTLSCVGYPAVAGDVAVRDRHGRYACGPSKKSWVMLSSRDRLATFQLDPVSLAAR